MSVTFSLPRSTRRTDYVATANQTVFGPTSGYLIFDPTDVVVKTRLSATSRWQVATPIVTLSATPGFATVTFATGLAAGTQVRVELRRVHPRVTDVTRAGALVSALIERELDTQTTVLQELRRDADDLDATALRVADGQTPSTLNITSFFNRLLGFDGAGQAVPITPTLLANAINAINILDSTSAGRALLTAADAAAQRSLLGVQPLAVSSFPTRTEAVAATIDVSVSQVLIYGRSTVNDQGGGYYARLGGAPGTVQSWHFASNSGTVWWQLVTAQCEPAQFGNVGTSDDTTTLQDWLDYAAAFDRKAHLPVGTYNVPTATLSIASGVIVEGDGETSIIRRTTNAIVPLLQASARTNVAVRDLRLDSTAGWSSSTSHSVTAGSKVFTVPAGIDMPISGSVQITSTASPQNYMIGTVTAYTGTSMTVNVTAAVGTGTLAAWRFDKFDGENCALAFDGCTNADATDLHVTGRFYVAVRSLNGNGDSFAECEISGAVNRPIYVYATSGTSDGHRITNNRVRGGGFAQYGINLNGSGGTIENVVISGNVVDNTTFQGIEVGGSCSFVSIQGNQVDAVTGAGIGILVQRANGVQPTRIVVNGNAVKNVTNGTGILVIDSFYCAITSNVVASCSIGIRIQQVTGGVGCQYMTVTANNVANCSADGIRFSAASVALGASHSCTGNVCVANTTFGIVSEANTDRISFTANVAIANGTQYSTSGTNHISAGNI
jgi:hypothetical protein